MDLEKKVSAIYTSSDLRKEVEAHYAVYNIKYIKKRFPEVRIAYPDIVQDEKTGQDRYIGRLMSGSSGYELNPFH